MVHAWFRCDSEELLLAGEVVRGLAMTTNTAPGPDSLPYYESDKAGPGDDVLAAMFSHCLAEARTLEAWKISNTILIYKKKVSLIACPIGGH